MYVPAFQLGASISSPSYLSRQTLPVRNQAVRLLERQLRPAAAAVPLQDSAWVLNTPHWCLWVEVIGSVRSHIPPQRCSPVGAEQSWHRIHRLRCMRGLVALAAEMSRECMGWIVLHRRMASSPRTDRCMMLRRNAVVAAVGRKDRAVLQLYDLKKKVNVMKENFTRRTHMMSHRCYVHTRPAVHKGLAHIAPEPQVPQDCYTRKEMHRSWLVVVASVAVLGSALHWYCKLREHMH